MAIVVYFQYQKRYLIQEYMWTRYAFLKGFFFGHSFSNLVVGVTAEQKIY